MLFMKYYVITANRICSGKVNDQNTFTFFLTDHTKVSIDEFGSIFRFFIVKVKSLIPTMIVGALMRNMTP